MADVLSKYVRGQLRIDTLLAFIFGTVFISVILYFTVSITNPRPDQLQVFKTVLALAGAGAAAMIPGRFEFKNLPIIRATGAIAVFALIFLTPISTVSTVAQFKDPGYDPTPTINNYLDEVDKFDFDAMWRLTDPAAAQWFRLSRTEWQELFENVRVPLGDVENRKIVSRGAAESPVNYPPGLFRHITYLTKFKRATGCRNELVVVRANESLRWDVFSHSIMGQDIPCLGLNLPAASEEGAAK